eukprot:GHVU01032751.1.p2 GENE.GHVU01032751.1~~GHVU01032751.1.p2  ORF type:complete len:118 (+),score=20.98 GHVU01032751.1:315-668(+)
MRRLLSWLLPFMAVVVTLAFVHKLYGEDKFNVDGEEKVNVDGEEKVKAYYINLNSSTGRRSRIEKTLGPHVDLERISAVTPKDLPDLCAQPPSVYKEEVAKEGELALTMSHLRYICM